MNQKLKTFNVKDFENGTSTSHSSEEAHYFKRMIVEGIEKELNEIETDGVKDTIHAIKGISSYAGLNRMHEVCMRLEHYHQVMRFKLVKEVLHREYQTVVNDEQFLA
ncbi:Hpt domain-containing protein [Aliivibrio fischeri]|uniref:Hpt domain-containing protein n=1 Tax=Aliivibrio fischeri TaxID=668 RepID=UPI0012D870E0|nr:Hpt domain-containing protein [Aliivibrio fischeri]MUI55821.1 Hpt domain-containing protein [Aliivibrio fischeri]